MSVEIRNPAFVEVVGRAAEVQKLAGEFMFIEGPVWDKPHASLIFTDIAGNRMHRWHPDTGVSVFREPSNMANGLTFDNLGRLLACEHATSRLTRTEKDGSITVLASHYQGAELNSPNDVVVHSDGSAYFTDPSYGRNDYYGVKRPVQLSFRGVYRVESNGAGGGEPILLADDFTQPNGLCFSQDERQLFVNDTERGHIRVFDVATNGRLSGGQVWAEVSGAGDGAPDGMKIDSEGNLYCTGPGGIHVFNSGGVCLGVINVPEPAANFNWGGSDLCSLFITATHGLYRTEVRVPGRSARF